MTNKNVPHQPLTGYLVICGHMVLVKCFSGMANAACEVFDAKQWDNVVGTLSGDDTFFILMRSEDDAAAICKQLPNAHASSCSGTPAAGNFNDREELPHAGKPEN